MYPDNNKTLGIKYTVFTKSCFRARVTIQPIYLLIFKFTQPHTTPHTFTVVYFSHNERSWHLRSVRYVNSLILTFQGAVYREVCVLD